MVAALGGPQDFLQRPETYLAAAPVIRPCPPLQSGIVQAVDARILGVAVLTLGGGRRRAEDKIDHRVGLTEVAGIGEHLDHARPLAMVHAADEETAVAAIAELATGLHARRPEAQAGADRHRDRALTQIVTRMTVYLKVPTARQRP